MALLRLRQGLLFSVLALIGCTAHAGLILTLEDGGGASTTVSDDDNDGLVTFNGALAGWLINVTTGLSNPAIGTDQLDRIHLNSVDVSGGAGTLTVTLTRTGLDGGPASWITALGGVADGTITFQTLLDGILISEYVAGAGAFSATDGGQIDPAGPYSLSLVAMISHEGGVRVSSFDYEATVPEPGSIALLGSGLVLMSLAGRRRKDVVSKH